MKNRKKKEMILIFLLLILALAAMGTVIWLEKSGTATESSEEEQDNQGYINYKGEKYVYNGNLKTLLFLGVDKDETATVRNVTGRSGQTDCIILMIMNQQDKTIRLLEISRDTMTDVDLYGMEGDYLETQTAQIATQYAYGTGEKDSCRLTADAVSSLLYDIHINGYLALNMAGIAPVVDAVGGVELTLEKDETAIDPSYTAGSVVTLNGEQAERYIRYRDTNVQGSNTDRMERQTEFIQALFTKVSESEDGGLEMVKNFWNAGEAYMTSSITLNTLEKLTTYTVDSEILSISGEMQSDEEHDEFYPDEESLQQMIIDVFYKKIE